MKNIKSDWQAYFLFQIGNLISFKFSDALKYDSNFSVSKCMISFSGHESEVNLGGGFRDLSKLPTLFQR